MLMKWELNQLKGLSSRITIDIFVYILISRYKINSIAFIYNIPMTLKYSEIFFTTDNFYFCILINDFCQSENLV